MTQELAGGFKLPEVGQDVPVEIVKFNPANATFEGDELLWIGEEQVRTHHTVNYLTNFNVFRKIAQQEKGMQIGAVVLPTTTIDAPSSNPLRGLLNLDLKNRHDQYPIARSLQQFKADYPGLFGRLSGLGDLKDLQERARRGQLTQEEKQSYLSLHPAQSKGRSRLEINTEKRDISMAYDAHANILRSLSGDFPLEILYR